jgi:molybdate transport system regulatory protein
MAADVAPPGQGGVITRPVFHRIIGNYRLFFSLLYHFTTFFVDYFFVSSNDRLMNPVTTDNDRYPAGHLSAGPILDPGRMIGVFEEGPCLDTAQLGQLEIEFRDWVTRHPRQDIRLSRQRILLIFLLIRYTGAKLNEVLTLNPFSDIDFECREIRFKNQGQDQQDDLRTVPLSPSLCSEIRALVHDRKFRHFLTSRPQVDPGFLRRKFYERAEACGFVKKLGGPGMIRKARAVELMKGNLPIPAIQKMLGHSTPTLTSAYVTFSPDDLQAVTRRYIQRETALKTSARNLFFGKIQAIQEGSVQCLVTVTTVSGHAVTAMITHHSLKQLGLTKGMMVTAAVKAPWIIVQKGAHDSGSSADNRFEGVVHEIRTGYVNTEFTIRISDGTLVCAVVSARAARELSLKLNDAVLVLFNCFAVILNVT